MNRVPTTELVASIRRVTGETQEELARRLGVTFPTLNTWERGHHEPRTRHRRVLEQIALDLGLKTGLTVLVIDDDKSAIDLIEVFVQSIDAHSRVEGATNGAKGLMLCGSIEPDIVFLDILMPGLDGVDVANRMREVPGLEKVRIVFITSTTDEQLLERARQADADGIVRKPIEPENIEKEINALSSLTPA